ncbi:MAG: hypothetical protein ACRD1S_07795 [Vicinamibacterales bacterium]
MAGAALIPWGIAYALTEAASTTGPLFIALLSGGTASAFVAYRLAEHYLTRNVIDVVLDAAGGSPTTVYETEARPRALVNSSVLQFTSRRERWSRAWVVAATSAQNARLALAA